MSTLVIVESPAKAKTIEKYLGADYKVVASVGHVRDLPKSEKKALDIENGFKPTYIISEDKEQVVKNIQKEIKKADAVLLATDPDREGEAIAWHLQEATGAKDAQRIVFHEITKDAVLEAITKPRKVDDNLRIAQEARRVLDRLFGYTLSKLIWEKVRYGLSAGRVQSPALRILMEREREIRAFEPVTFWELSGVFKRGDKTEHLAQCEKTFEDHETVKHILKTAPKTPWHIAKIKETAVDRNPKAPFTTSTLQQAANSVFNWSPSYTMRIAQKLYEAGQITYMRTDSVNLSKDAHRQIKSFITQNYDPALYKQNMYKTRSKSAQEAHEAIRPTRMEMIIRGKTKEEKALYDLIHKRTIAGQMVPAKMLRTAVTFSAKRGERSPLFYHPRKQNP